MDMKTRFTCLIAFALFLFSSCSWDEVVEGGPGVAETRGVMTIEVRESDGLQEDEIGTLRFLVFKDASGTPELELNHFESVPAPVTGVASKLEITLKVSRREGSSNDKIVVAIANEPAGMTSRLNAVSGYQELQDMELNLADFLNGNHLSLEQKMPMTCVVWTDEVFATVGEAELAGNLIEMQLRRAVSRVDVYVKKGDDVADDLKLASGTTAALKNSYGKQYFIRHQDNTHTFGRIQTVSTGFIDRQWTLSAEQAISTAAPVCTFYTPERTCSAAGNSDKLVLEISVLTSEGAVRSGAFTLTKAVNESQQEEDIEVIRRNNVYSITATVGANALTCDVSGWTTENIPNEL